MSSAPAGVALLPSDSSLVLRALSSRPMSLKPYQTAATIAASNMSFWKPNMRPL